MSSFFGELYLRSTMPFLTEERTEQDADYLVHVFGQGGTVLDVGCGHGRHASRLARRGVGVVGLDLDPLSLAQCKGSFPAVRGDFRVLPFGPVLTGAYCWYSTLFIGTDAENAQALRAVANCLRPRGLLVLQTVPYEWFARNPLASYHGRLPDGSTLDEENTFDAVARRDFGKRRLELPDGRVLTGGYTIRAYPVAELEALAAECSLEITWTHGDIDGSALTPQSRELIVGLVRK